MFGDLHNHTTASDGTYTPAQLVQVARDLGIKVLGVTDHDTLAGLDEAEREAQALGIKFVPGVEVSLRFTRPFFVGTLHYLLYIPASLFHNAQFREEAEHVLSLARGHALNKARVDKINALFGPAGAIKQVLKTDLTVEEIEALASNVTRRHFMLALKARGLETDTINLLISNDSAAYVPSGMEPADLKPLLDKYPQLVRILAHPAAGSFPGESFYKEVLPPVSTVIQLMAEMFHTGFTESPSTTCASAAPALLPVHGFEARYPGHTPELERIVVEWSTRYNLLVTGGSDCHDPTNRRLGTAGVGEEEANKLLHRLL
ncbi:error-prone DNA polymerase [Pelomyxa schiedti]|nr:error-prone DNA polymerase [Pelomyxa schiedti]